MVALHAGFSASVMDGTVDAENIQPTLQVLSVKKISTASGGATADRYRVILSDGAYFCQAMLATQLNDLVTGGELDKHTVVKLTSFVANAVQGRKLIIILALEIVEQSADRIGDPKNVEAGASAGASSAAPAANAPKPEAQRGGPVGRPAARTGSGGMGGPIFPIEALSPYSNKWTIKARVAVKSDIKHFSNARGDGKLFSVTFIDESGEIKATGFNDSVDTLFPLLQEGKVYFVSRARVNIAKKQFSNVKNDYEIMFERDTTIEECEDNSVPSVKFDFKQIDQLADVAKDEMVDVIGIVREVHDLGSITSKASQKPFAKRDIQLVDQSGSAVRLTLWGKQAESFDHTDYPVIAFKGVKVGDFGGRSLSMFSSATMSVNPDINEAHALRGWYDSAGHSANFTAYSSNMATRADGPTVTRPSEVKTIDQVKNEQLGMQDKTDYFTTSAVVAFVKNETFSYPACANPDGCNKKVVEGSEGWVCEKCDRTWPEPIHRYILSMNVMDHTSSFWATAFNDTAEQVLGISANDLFRLRDEDSNKFQSYFSNAIGRTFTFQMMAKQDNYNDQPRVRYNCRKINIPDYPAECVWLQEQIDLLSV